jgi:hypothetical protein
MIVLINARVLNHDPLCVITIPAAKTVLLG